jgi:cytidylate kinase
MDGRDIGSVVFPNADVKFFMTATPEERARRRFEELKAKGDETSFEAVLDNLKTRDHIDSTRAHSPLIQTEDAIVIDNTNLNQEQQLELMKKYVLNSDH